MVRTRKVIERHRQFWRRQPLAIAGQTTKALEPLAPSTETLDGELRDRPPPWWLHLIGATLRSPPRDTLFEGDGRHIALTQAGHSRSC